MDRVRLKPFQLNRVQKQLIFKPIFVFWLKSSLISPWLCLFDQPPTAACGHNHGKLQRLIVSMSLSQRLGAMSQVKLLQPFRLKVTFTLI